MTYDGGILPAMESFLSHIKAKNYQNRTVAFIENGSWAPMSGKLMRAYFDGMKNITAIDNVVTVRSAVKDDTEKELQMLAQALIK